MLESIKSVLAVFTEDGHDDRSAVLPYGLSLARKARAHLTVQASSVCYGVPSSLVGDFGNALIAKENRRIVSLAEAFADKAKGAADLAGIAYTIETPYLTYSDLRERFLAQARVHDLSVLDAETSAIKTDRGLIEAALFESGRPALIIPLEVGRFSGERILVAWDGGAAAARAVGDAMPFLASAEEVMILSVTGEKELAGQVAGVELARQLARHGAHVTIKNVAVGEDGSVVEAINREAAAFSADMIVAGAYKHSRLREILLGGVTQSLLKSCKLPLMMSHS